MLLILFGFLMLLQISTGNYPSDKHLPEPKEASVECCRNVNCTKTCTTQPHQACVRRACEPEERRSAKLEICPAGCGQKQIEYRVAERKIQVPFLDVPGAKPDLYVTFCKQDKCNVKPSLLESCRFAEKVAFENLECGCSKEGMHGTFLANLLDNNRVDTKVDFSALCTGEQDKVCKFSEIREELMKTNQWNPNFEENAACVFKQTGDHAVGAYGCDIMSQGRAIH